MVDMMKKKYLSLFLTFIIIFFACNNSVDLVSPIDLKGKILITPIEKFTSNNRILVFSCITADPFPSDVDSMYYTLNSIDNNISLNFLFLTRGKYIPPETPSEWVIEQDIELGKYDIGNYIINIKIPDYLKDIYHLNITNDYYEFISENESGIIFTNKKLMKIPEHTIWGQITISNEDTTLAYKLIDSLLSVGASKIKFGIGNYGYFVVDDSTQFFISSVKESNYYYYKFALSFNQNINKIKEISNYFKYKNNISFYIFDTDGNQY